MLRQSGVNIVNFVKYETSRDFHGLLLVDIIIVHVLAIFHFLCSTLNFRELGYNVMY